jgi:hypothetical protein
MVYDGYTITGRRFKDSNIKKVANMYMHWPRDSHDTYDVMRQGNV